MKEGPGEVAAAVAADWSADCHTWRSLLARPQSSKLARCVEAMEAVHCFVDEYTLCSEYTYTLLDQHGPDQERQKKRREKDRQFD